MSDQQNEMEVEIDPSTEEQIKAEKFITLIQEGSTPVEAARSIGTTLKKITTNTEMKEAVSQLVLTYNLTNEARRKLAEAGLTKMFLQGVDGDIEERKLALNIAKQLILGGGGKVDSGGAEVNINIDTVKDSLTGLDFEFAPEEKGDE